jgi:hypothetical protein
MSYYDYKVKRHQDCSNCIKLSEYNDICNKFTNLNVSVKTTYDDFIETNKSLGKKFMIIAKCGHEREVLYRDLKDLSDEMRNCVSCNRFKKNNGNLKYEQILERFEFLNCTLLTTEEYFKNNNMKTTSDFEIKVNKCGHTFTKSLANYKKNQTFIRCEVCRKNS